MIRARTPDRCNDIVELLMWCRDYQINGPMPRTPHERFCIGTYQVSQALGWNTCGPVSWQSYCAATIHTMMTAEGLGLGLEDHLPRYVTEFGETFSGFHTVLIHQGKAMQHLMYGAPDAGPHWKRRYRPAVLCRALASFVEVCFQMVPKEYRGKGISDEMGILCNDVVIK